MCVKKKKCTTVRLTDQTKSGGQSYSSDCVINSFLFPPWGKKGGGGEGCDDKAGEMMGCRCPSPTSEDEQLHPGAADKEPCSAEGHEGISSFVLWLP